MLQQLVRESKQQVMGLSEFMGSKGGYGNVVVLQHPNKISTVYGHLSRFSPNLHQGMKVSQGDIIAFVGMTGLATGPHLHYEFLLNGEHHDPLTVALPSAEPIPAAYRSNFWHKKMNMRLSSIYYVLAMLLQ